MACRAERPCLTALCETAALPSLVRGPVDFCAFRRLARIWAFVDINRPPGTTKPHSYVDVNILLHKELSGSLKSEILISKSETISKSK